MQLDNSNNSIISALPKSGFKLGNKTLLFVDDNIAKIIDIENNHTFYRQELKEDGTIILTPIVMKKEEDL